MSSVDAVWDKLLLIQATMHVGNLNFPHRKGYFLGGIIRRPIEKYRDYVLCECAGAMAMTVCMACAVDRSGRMHMRPREVTRRGDAVSFQIT